MAKTKSKNKSQQLDSVYLFKLVLYLIVGSQWLRISRHGHTAPLPVGLLIGLLFASHEHFQIDRKIEYAILLVATLVGFWSMAGFYIAL